MALSAKPMLQAAPALVVASALKPRPRSQRAEAKSQGFGRTKQPLSCRRRKAAILSAVLMASAPIQWRCRAGNIIQSGTVADDMPLKAWLGRAENRSSRTKCHGELGAATRNGKRPGPGAV